MHYFHTLIIALFRMQLSTKSKEAPISPTMITMSISTAPRCLFLWTILSASPVFAETPQELNLSDEASLRCSIEQRGKLSIFKAEIKEQRTTSVLGWRVDNGHCENDDLTGKLFGKRALKVVCTPDYGKSIAFHLKTKKGECDVSAEPGNTITFNGVTTLNENTVYQADNIKFTHQSSIITNGFVLYISASNKLVIGKNTAIKSFTNSIDKRQPGSHGKDAALISISTPLVEGAKITIDNHGETGAPGGKGSNGNKGGRGSTGAAGVHQGVQACVGRRTAGRGKKGSNGKQGENGGDAGNGGAVILQLGTQEYTDNFDKFVISQSNINPFTKKLYRCEGSCPGVPGPGGKGGNGGRGGPGGIAGIGHWPCLTGSSGKKGSAGKTGVVGAGGRIGTAGAILRPLYNASTDIEDAVKNASSSQSN